jgi:hypothetical protein
MPRCGWPLGIPKLRSGHAHCLLKAKIFLEIALFSGGLVERFDEA